MFRRSLLARPRGRGPPSATLNPMEMFDAVQTGTGFNHKLIRTFVLRHFTEQVMRRGLSEARINTLDQRSLHDLLRSLMYEHYVAVPFSVFSFDLEFTGLPGESRTPTSIIELAVYSPDTGHSFSSLVRPLPGSVMSDDAAQVTGITPAHLEGAPTFDTVFLDALKFMEENSESDEARSRVLMLSHGAKLADVNLLNDHCAHFGLSIPKSIKFGDTYNVIKDLHRKRPVTKEKQPPSWSVSELALWLKLETPERIHRALPDAQLTWEVLANTLDRYGESGLTPRQQLVSRYYPVEGESRIHELSGGSSSGSANADDAVLSEASKVPQVDELDEKDIDLDMFVMEEEEDEDAADAPPGNNKAAAAA